jgi:hypothetical protein
VWVTRARSVRRPWPGRPWRGVPVPRRSPRRRGERRGGRSQPEPAAGWLPTVATGYCDSLCARDVTLRPAMPRCSTRCAGAQQLFSNRSFPQTERQATATCVRARGSGLAGPTTCHLWAPTQAGPRPSWITRVSPKHNRPKIEVRHH